MTRFLVRMPPQEPRRKRWLRKGKGEVSMGPQGLSYCLWVVLGVRSNTLLDRWAWRSAWESSL